MAFETHQAARLRRQFKADLKASQRLLVMISRETWQSQWADWEISQATQRDKRLLATKLDTPNIAPMALLATDSVWVPPFDPLGLTQ